MGVAREYLDQWDSRGVELIQPCGQSYLCPAPCALLWNVARWLILASWWSIFFLSAPFFLYIWILKYQQRTCHSSRTQTSALQIIWYSQKNLNIKLGRLFNPLHLMYSRLSLLYILTGLKFMFLQFESTYKKKNIWSVRVASLSPLNHVFCNVTIFLCEYWGYHQSAAAMYPEGLYESHTFQHAHLIFTD